MRPTLTFIVLLVLQNIGSAQYLSSIDKRPELPMKAERATKVPPALAGNATLTFVDLHVYFDGGSYGAEFRRDNGRRVVIFFANPGYWTKPAIKNATQPVAILVNRAELQVLVEVEPASPLEKRILKLLTDDLANQEHGREQLKSLRRVRDCIRDRKPLREIRERFAATLKG